MTNLNSLSYSPAVKRACYSDASQKPHQGSQPLILPVPGRPDTFYPCWASGTHVVHKHTYRENIQRHTIK